MIFCRSALEAKARLYDELSSPNASKADLLAAQQMLLVDFKRKQRYQEKEDGEMDDDDDNDETPAGDYGDDDDWYINQLKLKAPPNLYFCMTCSLNNACFCSQGGVHRLPWSNETLPEDGFVRPAEAEQQTGRLPWHGTSQS